ncbi:hypothetical protein Mpsy_0136 [Methanolobus psychrophilus R15]|nr:hypothetical protein Mpsy_0136 [Methanolobus psychrophilus R15]
MYLTEDTWENISAKIGREGQRGTRYKVYSRMEMDTLEVIFPDEKENIKENAMLHIKIQIKHYNEKVPDKNRIDIEDIVPFIAFIEKNGLEHFLIFMADVNEDFFSNEYKSEKNLTFHLRNLSIFIEEIIKVIGLNSIPEISNKYPPRKSGFKAALSPLCQQEGWWQAYCELTTDGTISNVNATNFFHKIEDIPKLVESKKHLDEYNRIILTNLSRATIIRNYYAHNSTQIQSFRDVYPLLFESLINTLFMIWIIGRKNISSLE